MYRHFTRKSKRGWKAFNRRGNRAENSKTVCCPEKNYARDVKDNRTLCLPAKSKSIVIARDLKTSAVYFALQYTTTFVQPKKGLAKSKQGVRRKTERVRERQR